MWLKGKTMREPRHLSSFLPNVRVLRRLEEEIQKSRHKSSHLITPDFYVPKEPIIQQDHYKQNH